MTITTEQLQNVREELNAALKLVSEKTGFTFALGNIRYGKEDFRCTLTGVAKSESGEAVTKERVDLDKYAFVLGENYVADKVYRHPRLGNVTIVGWRARARKSPVIIGTEDGSQYTISEVGARAIINNMVGL